MPSSRVLRYLAAALLSVAPLTAAPDTPDSIAREVLAPLLDPAKLATLKGDRPANPRLYKVMFWIETGRRMGGEVSAMIDIAQTGYKDTVGGRADKAAILWSHRKLERWGCFTEAGMEKLRRGGSPTITQGEHKGDGVALDHVLPRAIVPELAARFYNLEALPSIVNRNKSATITEREVALARRWHKLGMLSVEGLAAVENAGKE